MTKHKKHREPKLPRGQNWDTIHQNLEMLARRIVTAKGGFDDIKIVYECMAVAKEYEIKASPSYIAKKLTKLEKRDREREDD